ncbi:U box domain-containing hypothetical protein [Phytophthora megakarya]|uniref:U-box domain-containing protein n=1 Tax=Phytophthora megakarya TaxID=4795 RepID=A0A225VLG0_9STRA|nr:U box domain-containing hypothetical protein [Phytophthora megakarya]
MASCSAPTSGASVSSVSSVSSRSSVSTHLSAGLLNVEVLGARNLPPAVLGSLLKWTPSYSNPYVVLSLDRERFVSSVKQHDLNPSWKETGKLNVPLPSESEVLQTAGVPGGRSADGGGKVGSKGKAKGGKPVMKKTGAAAAAADAVMGYRQYFPCAPELYVQVFHRAVEDATVASNSSSVPHVAALGPDDKLIGAVVVPLLPCLLSNASSSRGWYQLTDEETQSAGQLQLSLDFDVSAASNELEPRKGDIVRLTGFGGLEYYSKVLPPGARLEVLDIFQDQTFVASSKDAYGQVKHEFVRVYWSAPRRVTNGTFDGGYDDDLVDYYEDHEEEMMMHWDTYEDSEDYEEDDENEGEPHVPEQLICPITGCPMLDPVVAADGHSYEREAIMQWFTTSDISPMTGMHMPTTQVFPNFTLRQLSEEVQAATTRRQQAKRRRHRRHSATLAQVAEQDVLEDKAASSEGSQE